MSISAFDGFVGQWKNHPKATIVEKLLEAGTVETLTEFKVNLIHKCRSIAAFPKGESYARRKPKGKSLYNTLEERLADDISELLICIDSGVVNPEVKSMFKPQEDDSLSVGDETFHGSQDITNFEFGTPILDATQVGTLNLESRLTHKHCADRIAAMEANFFIFKEEVKQDIHDISATLSEKEKLIKKQSDEISKLKTENFKFKSQLVTLENRLNDQRSLENNADANRPLYSERIKNSRSKKRIDGNVVVNSNSLEINSNSIQPNENQPQNSEESEIYPVVNLEENIDRIPDATLEQSTVNNNAIRQQDESQYNEQITSACVAIVSDEQSNPSTTDYDGFTGVKRKRMNIKRFFLGGIADHVTAEMILGYLEQKNIRPTQLRVFSSRRKGTISAKLNVKAVNSAAICKDEFWPKFVICKPWMTKEKLGKAYLKRNDEK